MDYLFYGMAALQIAFFVFYFNEKGRLKSTIQDSLFKIQKIETENKKLEGEIDAFLAQKASLQTDSERLQSEALKATKAQVELLSLRESFAIKEQSMEATFALKLREYASKNAELQRAKEQTELQLQNKIQALSLEIDQLKSNANVRQQQPPSP